MLRIIAIQVLSYDRHRSIIFANKPQTEAIVHKRIEHNDPASTERKRAPDMRNGFDFHDEELSMKVRRSRPAV